MAFDINYWREQFPLDVPACGGLDVAAARITTYTSNDYLVREVHKTVGLIWIRICSSALAASSALLVSHWTRVAADPSVRHLSPNCSRRFGEPLGACHGPFLLPWNARRSR